MPEDVVTGSTSGTENAGSTAGAGGSLGAVSTGAAAGSTGVATPTAAPSALASLQKISAAASSAANLNKDTVTPQGADAGTTVQPGQPGANSGATGEDASWLAIPETRREAILKNTREKAAAEALSGVEWAKGVTRESYSEAVNFASTINDNPVGFAVQLVGELLDHPQGQRAIMQALAPLFQQGGGQPGVRAGAPSGHQFRSADGRFSLPEGRLRDETGKVKAYSEEQMIEILTNFEDHLESKFGDRLAPVEGYQQSLQEREEVAEVVRSSREEGATLMTEMRGMMHWPKDGPGKAGEQKIGAYLASIPKEVKQKLGAYGSMMRAFNMYKEKDVYPTLAGTAQQQVRDDLKRKAAAGSGTVAPNGQAITQPAPKPRNREELARHMERLAGQGTA